MKYIFLLLTILSCTWLNAQLNMVWVKQLGGPLNEASISIVIDPLGNSISTGYFYGTVDFDPGPAVFNVSAIGTSDGFISKLDPSGNFLWVKIFTGATCDLTSNAVSTDEFGNIYTTGSFYGVVDFDAGPGIFNLTSQNYEIYITKSDADGNFIWAKKMDGAFGTFSIGYGITTDSDGNVYTTGTFNYGLVDFDPGPAIFLLDAPWDAIFISKLNKEGEFVFAKSFAGGFWEANAAFSIAVDASRNIYTAGQFIGSCNFDPGPTASWLTSLGQVDGYISKFDALGNFVWAKNISGSGMEWATSVAVDGAGNVFTTGSFSGTISINGTLLTTVGDMDIFIAKFNAAGITQWVTGFGGTQEDLGIALILDNVGNVYTTGAYRSGIDFDPGPANYQLMSVGSSDVFVTKLNNAGNFISAASFGGTGIDIGKSIAVSPAGEVVISGFFNGTADFDPSANSALLTSAGQSDLFIVKLNQNEVLPVTITKISGEQKNSAVLIKWAVEQQLNIDKYEIERSKDGQLFSTIGTVKAIGNINQVAAYEYFDSSPFEGNNYYRLKIIELGKFNYSRIVKVIVDGSDKNLIHIFPNPVSGNSVSIETKLSKGRFVISLTNSIGQALSKTSINHSGGLLSTRLPFTENIPAGIYYINIKGEEMNSSSSFIRR